MEIIIHKVLVAFTLFERLFFPESGRDRVYIGEPTLSGVSRPFFDHEEKYLGLVSEEIYVKLISEDLICPLEQEQ